MNRFGHAVNVWQVLNIALEARPEISIEDDDDYVDHLTDKVIAAFEADQDLFNKLQFWEYHGQSPEFDSFLLAG